MLSSESVAPMQQPQKNSVMNPQTDIAIAAGRAMKGACGRAMKGAFSLDV
jgi:hypothetical protein